MNKDERHTRESAVIAAAITAFVLVCFLLSEMAGFDKMNPGATPKRMSEIVAEWPRFLILGVVTFVGSLWWQISQIEPSYLICRGCKDLTEKKNDSPVVCGKCGGELEDLDGFYDRHPEMRK